MDKTLCSSLGMAIRCAGMFMLLAAPVVGAQTATQVVRFSVVSASRASFGSMSQALPTRSAPMDAARSTAAVGQSTYGIATNEANQKIVASLSAPLPKGVSIAVNVSAPEGARSAGSTKLSTKATDVVTGISAVSASELPIAYAMSAQKTTGNSPSTVIVTYTITAGI
ncbi:MAG: hypothetical protein ABJA80_08520 [bacterium]